MIIQIFGWIGSSSDEPEDSTYVHPDTQVMPSDHTRAELSVMVNVRDVDDMSDSTSDGLLSEDDVQHYGGDTHK